MTVIAASVGVAVATATGVTYASSALESAPESAPITKDAAPAPPRGGNGTGTNAGSNAAADAGRNDSWGGSRKGNEGQGNEGRGENRGDNRRDDDEDDRRDDEHDGHVMINERTYGAEPGSCIAVVNVNQQLIGATTFNIRNESKKTVEFFNGITCDNGSPAATVGPHSSTTSIEGENRGNLILGSFRVIDDSHNSHHSRR